MIVERRFPVEGNPLRGESGAGFRWSSKKTSDDDDYVVFVTSEYVAIDVETSLPSVTLDSAVPRAGDLYFGPALLLRVGVEVMLEA